MREVESQEWEVLVPTADNQGQLFSVTHHQLWDEHVRGITGGLTIMRTARGQWVSDDGQLFSEKMIPVRVACDKPQVREIMGFTMTHYGQLAVKATLMSECAIIMYAEQL
jgi:hypothetical protein